MANIAHHTNHLFRSFTTPAKSYLCAKRAPALKKAPNERLIHDGNGSCSGRICRRKSTALHKGNPHGFEVLAFHETQVYRRFAIFFVANHFHGSTVVLAAERKTLRGTCRSDARLGSQSLEYRFIKLCHPRRLTRI